MPERSSFPPALRDAILAWYGVRGRRLPFRLTTDPFAILVSEAMAQQTQAARAGERWVGFMARFPTVEALAAATPAAALRAWQGLGYNRRALYLWRTAGRIVEAFDGQVPRDLATLESLPGVGPYTARAVAAIAFGMPVGAVDTNVRRVLGRIVTGEDGALTPAALQRLADGLVPPDRPGAWTHALMDIGATVCRPKRPDCEACPAQEWCRYAARTRAAAATGGRSAQTPAAAVRTGRSAQTSATARTGSSTRTTVGARTPATPARAAATPFRATSRWLRGRILDRLREAPDGAWVAFDPSIGDHDSLAIDVAIRALAKEGLLELDGAGGTAIRARLPIG